MYLDFNLHLSLRLCRPPRKPGPAFLHLLNPLPNPPTHIHTSTHSVLIPTDEMRAVKYGSMRTRSLAATLGLGPEAGGAIAADAGPATCGAMPPYDTEQPAA
ncbi:hypothetical protein Vretimale_19958 [Volvox reticuliferus]|uniref:Uncharacterized protein n=1 Tax=Volvox reticuliferus TaxID=1737510 RepID=A0A8J4H021_9CHLO|nr:hypothetical protein Vretimale_19958 [Volvox reticuliferus]